MKPAFYSPKLTAKYIRIPDFRIFFKDGRNVLLTSAIQYDVIISEPSNPWITGVSNLFTLEFYESGLSRLNKNGIFCQWFHIYDMPLKVMQSQVKTFCSVFPEASLWIVPPYYQNSTNSATQAGDVILLGSRTSIQLNMAKIRKLYTLPGPREDLIAYGIDDPLSFVSNAILDRDALLRFSGNAILNTDDYPFIEFNAPLGMFHTSEEMHKQLNLLYDTLESADTVLILPLVNEPTLVSPIDEKKLAILYDSLGNLYINKFMFNHAERLLNKAHQLNPNSIECARSMVMLNVSRARYDDAIFWCHKAIDIDPKLLPSWDFLGSVYYNLGNFDEAKKVYQQVMARFPKDAKGALKMGMIYYKEKNFQVASIFLHKDVKSTLTTRRLSRY